MAAIIRSATWRDNKGLLLALTAAAGLKAALWAADVVPFNADEAVVALMAKHILQGERPVFFYGQAYMGSLDAWLIAGMFLLAGQSVLAVRIVQGLLYLGTILTTYLLGLAIFNSRWTAAAAALLLSIPAVLVTLYTTASIGGYGETLLIGNALLLWTLRLRTAEARAIEWFLFGGLAGLGFWAFGLLGVYLPPVAIALVIRNRKDSDRASGASAAVKLIVPYLFAAAGLLVGSSPWWRATLEGRLATIDELSGAAIAVASPSSPLASFGRRVFNLIVLGLPVILGLRPPWAVRWVGLPLAPFAIAAFFGTAAWAIWSSRADWRRRLLLGVCLTLAVAFVLTPFGADPSGRYFLPLAAPLALFTADMLNRARQEYPRAAAASLGVLLAFNLWGNVESALAYPPGITTQFDAVAQVDQRDMPAVIDFLLARGETRGYSNYWVAFPAAFLSDERIIFSAALPYHLDFRYTPRDDRYAPYTAAVAGSGRAAYVTTNHPPLDERLRSQFAALGVAFEEKTIGDFHIFYNLSRKVTPEELDLSPRS